MIGIDNLKFNEFFLRTAQLWQFKNNYDFLDFIKLSQEQIEIIEKKDAQMLISGSAGSGKSITLLYKMIKIMMDEKVPQRILYLTFNSTLVSDTYKRACLSEEFQEYRNYHEINIWTFHKMSYEILSKMGFRNVENLNINIGTIESFTDKICGRLYPIWEYYTDPSQKGYRKLEYSERLYSTHDVNFIAEEILWMKANGYIKKDDYLEVERNGRGNAPRLTKTQRNTIYKIFLEYERRKEDMYHGHMDLEDYALKLLENFHYIPEELYYDYIFVDEVQDLQAMQLKVLAKLAKKTIVIAGDSKQKIYKRSPHSYADLGINIIGSRNKTLTRTFRSTKQIVKLANSLSFTDIESEKIHDIEEMAEGYMPEIHYYPKTKNQIRYIIKEIKKIHSIEEGATIAVIHREEDKILRRQKSYLRKQLEMNFR
ncbi:UvrD-helicase domain-containing protein, partial [Clostridium sp. Cult2]|uniref:UvrD-helicase domain-containing protein n=1 Tax=Clostridium sp. Cult2 TaxID=2079003 RepID=UPI001F02A2E4